ncbi:MAG: peptidoglycan-binding protein [Lysobacteraceae bacterium]|nr:MAG: peptidoglycan-binding protein [Xanthomonadaceae bacterium]
MSDENLPRYRVIQLGSPNRNGQQTNVGVTDLDSLVTHHPGSNAGARLVDGVPTGVENPRTRSYGVIGGEIQELETARTDEYGTLKPNQVLMVKDFILENANQRSGTQGVRNVDVPSPVAGYVGRVDAKNGLVEIYDREGGDVIARVRHMGDIQVKAGDTIEYGQALGTQSNVATKAIHVHMEVDTRYHQQFDNYIEDLSSGRLRIDPARRTQGIEPRPVTDDGVFRIGETGDRVRDAQRFLSEQGFRGRDKQPLAQDGTYSLDMQPAVIAFQRARGLPQTGDLDAATLALIPSQTRTQSPANGDMQQQGANTIDRLSPQEREMYTRAVDAVKAQGGFTDEQARNIAAAGVAAFKGNPMTADAADIGVYGDRLRITNFPNGRDREPNYSVDLRLADAAQIPEQRSLEAVLNRAQPVVEDPAVTQVKQPEAANSAVGARGL